MRLNIQGDGLRLTLVSDKDLDTKQIVMAHQLATGNYEALFVDESEDEEATEIDNETGNKTEIKQNHAANRWDDRPDTQERRRYEKGDPAKTMIDCPVCGNHEITKTYWMNSFTPCPKCETRLFNRFAKGQPGAEDENGCVYRSDSVIRRKDDEQAPESGIDVLIKKANQSWMGER